MAEFIYNIVNVIFSICQVCGWLVTISITIKEREFMEKWIVLKQNLFRSSLLWKLLTFFCLISLTFYKYLHFGFLSDSMLASNFHELFFHSICNVLCVQDYVTFIVYCVVLCYIGCLGSCIIPLLLLGCLICTACN